MAGLLDLLGFNSGPQATQNGQVVGPADGGAGLLAQFTQRLRDNSDSFLGAGMGFLSGGTQQEGFANAMQGMQAGQRTADRRKLLAQEEQQKQAKQASAQKFLQAHPEYAQKYGADASDPDFVQKLAGQQAANDFSPDKFDRVTGADGSMYAVNKADPSDVRKIPIAPAAAQWSPVTIKDASGTERTMFQRGGQFATPEQLGIPGGGNGANNPYAMPGRTTNDQTNAATYADRTAEAHKILTQNEDLNQGASGALGAAVTGAAGMVGADNMVSSKQRQIVTQAQRDFVNAQLRKESGAAISPSEFENAQKQYFPQPGDTTEVIAQKRANRETAIRGMMRGAGPGYSPPEDWKSGQAPVYTSGAKSDAPKPPSNAVQIRSVEDYNKLPKGSPYIDPNGRQRVKQ